MENAIEAKYIEILVLLIQLTTTFHSTKPFKSAFFRKRNIFNTIEYSNEIKVEFIIQYYKP